MKAYERLIWAFWLALPLTDFAAGVTSQQIKLVRVPDGGLQPQALVDSAGTLHLVYLSGDPKHCDVWYARKAAGETNFSKTTRVNSIPDSAIAVGTVRGAQLALGRNARIHVVWNGSDRVSSSNGSAPMLYSRINDAGDGFEPQRDLMTCTTHLDGGGSVAADQNGRVYAVWHGHKRTGPQEEIDRGVFVAFSTDDGKTFTPERQVNPKDTGVCGCCGLKAFVDDNGSLAILYRSANEAGNRDSVLLLSTNYGESFQTALAGQWHVSTCPMSTYALGAAGGKLFGSWETAGQVYTGAVGLQKASPVGSTPVSGSSSNCKHPTFASSKPAGPMLIAWTEGTGWEKGGTLAWICNDQRGVKMCSGRTEGVPVWGSVAAVAELDGSFTIFY